MSSFSEEIVSALKAIKENGSKEIEHSKEEMEVLFLASLLEEENNG